MRVEPPRHRRGEHPERRSTRHNSTNIASSRTAHRFHEVFIWRQRDLCGVFAEDSWDSRTRLTTFWRIR